MSNDYFQHEQFRVPDGTTARGSDVNNPLDQVQQGFDRLPDEAAIHGGTISYGTATTTGANAYAITLARPATAYRDGMALQFRVPADNTGAATLNLDGLGVRAIRRQRGTALQGGDLRQGTIVHVRFNAPYTRFELVAITREETVEATNELIATADSRFTAVLLAATEQATLAQIRADLAHDNAQLAHTHQQAAGVSANASAQSAITAAQTAANVGSLLGINFGGWALCDGDLIVSHLSTTTPSIVDGDLHIEYEQLEDNVTCP